MRESLKTKNGGKSQTDLNNPSTFCLSAQDVDEDEVDDAIAGECYLEVIVQLKVPIYTQTVQEDRGSPR